jgi:hypothetical protein
MSFRIIRTIDRERTTVKVAGRLQPPFESELDREIRSIDGPFVLDLSELLSSDDAGIEKLCQLASGGTELRGASGYVQMLLDDKGS